VTMLNCTLPFPSPPPPAGEEYGEADDDPLVGVMVE